jgi:spore germination protein YaaH
MRVYRRAGPNSASWFGLAAVLLAAVLLAPAPIVARTPDPAAGGAESGEPAAYGRHYLDLLAHAHDPVSFEPGGPVRIGYRPRIDDRRPVDGRWPVALPAARSIDPSAPGSRAAASSGTAGAIGASAQVNPNGLRREVFGFLPYWEVTDPDTRLDFSVLSTIAYFGVGVGPDGHLVHADVDGPTPGWSGWMSGRLTTIIEQAHGAGTRVVLALQRFSWTTTQRAETVALLSDPAARATLASEAATAVRDRGADGINLDFEPIPSGQRDNFTALVREIRAALDALAPGYQLTFDSVAEGSGYDIPALAAPGAADAVVVMGYDYRTASASSAGSVAPLNGTAYDLTDTVSRFLGWTSPDRIILALPYYGRAWSTLSDGLHASTRPQGSTYGYSAAVTYSNAVALAAQYGRRYDGLEQSAWTSYPRQNCSSCPMTSRQAYWEDAQSLGAKYDLVNQANLRGTGMWALGYDGSLPELYATLAAKFLTDRTPPRAGILDLPDTVDGAAFPVQWTAVDDWSGVASVDLQVSEDGGPWTDWLTGIIGTVATYTGRNGHGYAFRVRATDGLGNRGDWTTTATWSATPTLAPGGFARVIDGPLNMRDGPSTSASSLGTLPTGTLVALTGGPAISSGYTWFQATAPITEWGTVGLVEAGVWIAASGPSGQFLEAVQAPNATTVASTAAVALDLTVVPAGQVPLGSVITLRAALSAAAAGQAVTFEAQATGTGSFAPVGTAMTDASGVAQLVVTVASNATYRATLVGDGTPGSAASQPVAVIAVPTPLLKVAAGYRTKLTSSFGTAVTVRNATYATLRASLGPALAGARVQFHVRVGKEGAWKLVTTGRADASGTCTWSRLIAVPSSATGYARYLYLRVVVPVSAAYAEGSSGVVRVVVRR